MGLGKSRGAECWGTGDLWVQAAGGWGSGVPLTPSCTALTWHMDHAAVAALHHGLLLALEPAGSDAVGVVAGQHLLPLHAGPAVPPWLWQVGELSG